MRHIALRHRAVTTRARLAKLYRATLGMGTEVERPLREAVHARLRGERLSARHQAQGEENARFHKHRNPYPSLNFAPSYSVLESPTE